RPLTESLTVGIDAQLGVGTATGIGEYVRGLLGALATSDARASGLLGNGAKMLSADVRAIALYERRLDPWRFDRRIIWDQILLPVAARRARVDVLHCAAGTLPLAARLPPLARVPLVATVHDVAWLRSQHHARPYARAYFGALQRRLYGWARMVFVDSAFSRDELLESTALEPQRVQVLYPGVADDVMQVIRNPDRQPFALVVGTVEVRKNLEILVRALPSVPELRLVSVGPFTPYLARVRDIARTLGVDERFDVRGYVSRSELLDLYARAAFAAVPSRYEGFGYAAAQALCAGVPLIAANAASLPEIVDGGAPLVAPDDVGGWVDAMRSRLAERASADACAAAGRAAAVERFGWKTGARLAITAYRRVANEQ
ncbi:MAG: glycosyltransferase family 4 protein, partial [Candidatus Eremiobacteraeota bacterium]|nr:glycosyltransferase family 4 protein [Candidatus Eremiobacteraeota bacterium]